MKEYKLVEFEGQEAGNVENYAGGIPTNGVYGGVSYGEPAPTGYFSYGGATPNGGDTNASTVTTGATGTPVTNPGTVGGTNTGNALPQKVGLWGKIKNFLFQEIDLNKEIVLELTPKEEKVLKEVHDFWLQDISFPELHDFLFQEITIFGKKK